MARDTQDAILTVEDWNTLYPGTFLPGDVSNNYKISEANSYCPTASDLAALSGATGAESSITATQCVPRAWSGTALSKEITVKVMESLNGSASIDYINFWCSNSGDSINVGSSSWSNVSGSATKTLSLIRSVDIIKATSDKDYYDAKTTPGITAGTLGASRAWYISDNIHPTWWKVADSKTLNHRIKYYVRDEENYTENNSTYGGKVRPMTFGEWFSRIGTMYIYIRNTNDGAPSTGTQVTSTSHGTFGPWMSIYNTTSSASVASVIGDWDEDETLSTEATEPTTWSLRRGTSMDETQVSVNTVEELTEESSDFKPKYEVNLYPNGHYEIVEIDYSNDDK